MNEITVEEYRGVFQALRGLKQSLGQTCTELEAAAAAYGKPKKIPPAELREWAGDMPNRNPNKRIRKWCYVIAFDVLRQHGIDPLQFIPAVKAATYWALLKRETVSLEEACREFSSSFKIIEADKEPVELAIRHVYLKEVVA